MKFARRLLPFTVIGKLIQDRQHTRDRTKGIDQFTETVVSNFGNKEQAYFLIEKIKEIYPRLVIGLGVKGVERGCKVIFTSMGDLVHTLKTEEITRKSKARVKRIREADLVIIDDLMFMAMNQQEANDFFHLVNDLHNKSSIVLTSKKAPKEWGELLGDQAITTAILDRILHRVEIIPLNG